MKKNPLIKLSIILLFFLSIFTGGNASAVAQNEIDYAYTFLSDNNRTTEYYIHSLRDFLNFADSEDNESKKSALMHSIVQAEKKYTEYQVAIIKSSEFHISDFILFESDTSPPANRKDLKALFSNSLVSSKQVSSIF